MCRKLKSPRKPFQHQILQRTALSLEWQCVLENLITYQQFNFMIVALPTLIVTCENGDDRVIMLIVIQNFKLWWWRGGASSVCIWRSAAVFPQDLLSPSLISTTANFDVDTWWWWWWIWGGDGKMRDHVVTIILIQNCVVSAPTMVLILGVNPPRPAGGWSPLQSSGCPMSSPSPNPSHNQHLDPSCLQPIPCCLCTCMTNNVCFPREIHSSWTSSEVKKPTRDLVGSSGSEMESVMFHLRTAASPSPVHQKPPMFYSGLGEGGSGG